MTQATKVTTQFLTYADAEGTRLIGFLAQPDSDDIRGGLIFAPEWWGLNDYVKERAQRLAAEGYLVLGLDLYGEGRETTEVPQANAWMQALLQDPSTLQQRTEAGLAALIKQLDTLNSGTARIGALGSCFGGKVVLDLARSGANLNAVATFHANLTPKTPAQKGQIKAALLVQHGLMDTMVPLDDLAHFEAEMQQAEVQYTVTVYPGARHGFTNPLADQRAREAGVDLGYNAKADADSWAMTLHFLRQHLQT